VSRESRVTGQLTDGSRGSRVKKCDPLSFLASTVTSGTRTGKSRVRLTDRPVDAVLKVTTTNRRARRRQSVARETRSLDSTMSTGETSWLLNASRHYIT